MSSERDQPEEKFSSVLRSYRQKLGLSQNTLAGAADIEVSHLNRIENGQRNPPKRKTVMRLALALGLSENAASNLLLSAGYAPLGKNETETFGLSGKEVFNVSPEASKIISETTQAIINLVDNPNIDPSERQIIINVLSRIPKMISELKQLNL